MHSDALSCVKTGKAVIMISAGVRGEASALDSSASSRRRVATKWPECLEEGTEHLRPVQGVSLQGRSICNMY
eukprot:5351555-Amphidinium_carterae.2